ncbi:MAG: glycosyltransferase family 4 protein [Phormidesmis sp.]
MKVKNVLVTGEALFLQRHRFLFEELAQHVQTMGFLEREPAWYEASPIRKGIKAWYGLRLGSLQQAHAAFQKHPAGFRDRSQRLENRIYQLPAIPDLIFHVFATYRPFWYPAEIPYVLFLDFTSALSGHMWQPWAAAISPASRQGWLECEGATYTAAHHIFCTSTVVKQSLIEDYGQPDPKVTVVGAAGNFVNQPYTGEKNFGSQVLLFNGSDFERKGGDIVLAAFKKVRQALPNARLVVIGKKLDIAIDGVENLGSITDADRLISLFLNADLVLAPARCDPFAIFILDAMNYGVPCVIAKNPACGTADFVQDGVNGFVIDQDPLDPDTLARRVIQLLKSPEQLAEVSQAARETMKKTLSWQAIAAQMMQVLAALPEKAEI